MQWCQESEEGQDHRCDGPQGQDQSYSLVASYTVMDHATQALALKTAQ